MSGTSTKRMIAEQVLRRLSGGDISQDTDFDFREIILLIEQAVNLLVKANIFDSLRYGATEIGAQYISSFRNVPVQFDESINLAFSEVPCNYIDLPQQRGIYQVSPMQDQFQSFIPVGPGFLNLYSRNPAGRLEGQVGYWPEQLRIYYTRNILKEGCKNILLKIVVPSPEMVGDDDPYPIGSDLELPVIQKVLELLGVRVQADDTNDNSNAR